MEDQKKEELVKNSNQVDVLLTIVNGWGPFQWLMIFSFCLMILPASYQVFIMVFLTLQPEWTCSENSTACPWNTTFQPTDNFRCSLSRKDWEFVKPTHYSIVTEFDIYCDTEWLLQLTTGIFFVGAGFGGLLLGKLADTIGRKQVLFISLGCIILNGLISAFAPTIYVFIAQRFLSGFFYAGTLGQMVVMSAELVGAHRRPFAGNSIWFFYSAASCILALKAYYLHDWKIFVVVCTVPYFLVLLFYFTVPESVRWLSVKGDVELVNEIWQKIAKRNKRNLGDIRMRPILSDELTKSGFQNLFRPLRFGIMTLVQMFAWMVTSMVYYGLSLAAGELGGDLYRNFVLVSIMECPGHICGAFLSNKFGRKKTAMIPIFLGGLTCGAIPLIPSDGSIHILRVGLGMFGKFFITTCYSCIYLWSTEIFPTSDRAKGIGLMQVFEMIGGACSPFVIAKLSVINEIAPFLLLAFCAIVTSGLMMLLPETRKRGMQ